MARRAGRKPGAGRVWPLMMLAGVGLGLAGLASAGMGQEPVRTDPPPTEAALPDEAPTGPRTYVVDPAGSAVAIHVGKSGLFKFAGHEHEVVAPALRGEVLADPRDLARSAVWVTFEASALRVTGKGEPADDVPKVQEVMVGPRVLDVARFPEIAFRSRTVAGRALAPSAYELQVTGDLTLHGVTRSLALPVRVETVGQGLTASGRALIRHTDFGMKPVSVAGVVNVKNEIAVEFRITARAGP